MMMYEELFFADEAFQSCLLYVHALCDDMSNTKRHKSSEEETIHLIKVRNILNYLENYNF